MLMIMSSAFRGKFNKPEKYYLITIFTEFLINVFMCEVLFQWKVIPVIQFPLPIPKKMFLQ